MVVGTTAFADTSFVPGQRMGQELEGQELEAFHEAMLDQKQEWIDGLVEDEIITAEEGEAFIAGLEDNMANCDGTQKFYGRSLNVGQGNGFGAKNGFGNKDGSGRGQGKGRWQAEE